MQSACNLEFSVIISIKYFLLLRYDRICMDFVQVEKPKVTKPIIIAAMQDMGNVGSIVINFINKNLNMHLFRYVCPPHPNYVIDKGGYIDFQRERWEYRYGRGIIGFGAGVGQPQTNQELYELCSDVISIAKMNDIKGIGLYSEINEPRIPQYRSAKSVLQLLERLTFHNFGQLEELDIMAEAVEKE